MIFGKITLFLLACVSLVASVVFSLKSFTGYLISDIPDMTSNLLSFLFLTMGLIASWVYVYNYRKRQ